NIRDREKGRVAVDLLALARMRDHDDAGLQRDDSHDALGRSENAGYPCLARVFAENEKSAESDRDKERGGAEQRERRGADEEDRSADRAGTTEHQDKQDSTDECGEGKRVIRREDRRGSEH